MLLTQFIMYSMVTNILPDMSIEALDIIRHGMSEYGEDSDEMHFKYIEAIGTYSLL